VKVKARQFRTVQDSAGQLRTMQDSERQSQTLQDKAEHEIKFLGDFQFIDTRALQLELGKEIIKPQRLHGPENK